MAGLAELPWLLGPSAVICVAAVVALGVMACPIATAATMGQLWPRLACALSAGVALLLGAEAMPVYRAADGARIAGGASIGGALVRVEHH